MKIALIKIVLLVLLFISNFLYAQQKQIKIYSDRSNESGDVTIFADNYSNENYTVLINFTKLENAQHGFSNPYIRTVSPGKSTILNIKKNSMSNGRINYNYKYSYRKGCLETKPDNKVVYIIPTSENKKTKIGFGKISGHRFDKEITKNWETYVFSMNKGDTIYAARKGKIVSINNSNLIEEKASIFNSRTSSLKILHKDCTYGQYRNFDKFFVSENDVVYPGKPLGTIKAEYRSKYGFLMFNVHYFEIKELSNAKLESNTVYVSLKFDVNNRAEKLYKENLYFSKHRFETITQEMSKREIKKYKKKM